MDVSIVIAVAALAWVTAAAHRRWSLALPVAAAGAALTAASTLVLGTRVAAYPTVAGCADGCEVVAGGWPALWLLDNPSLSPVESVFFMGAVLGIDRVDWLALGVDLVFWIGVVGGLAWTYRRTTGGKAGAAALTRSS